MLPFTSQIVHAHVVEVVSGYRSVVSCVWERGKRVSMFSAVVDSEGKSQHKKYYNAKRKSRRENWHVKVGVYLVAVTCLFGYIQLKPQFDGFARFSGLGEDASRRLLAETANENIGACSSAATGEGHLLPKELFTG
jgi:hypothetical protein